MPIAQRRIVLWIFAAATLAVFAAAPAQWPGWIVERLDHCPELGCDFVHHYIAQARQLRGDLVFGWVYPPLLALGLQPLTAFSDAGALRLWMLLQSVAIVGLLVMCRQTLLACGRVTSWAGAVALVVPSLPVLHAFKWGQVSTFIVVGAVWALTRERGRAAAIVLGVSAALKLYPLVYLVGAWLRRDRRFLLWAGGTALAVGLVLPLVVLGPQTTARYFASAFAVKWNHVGYLGGQALWPTLVRLFVTGRHAGVEPEAPAALLFGIGMVGTGSAAAVARMLVLLVPVLAVAWMTWRALRRSGTVALQSSADTRRNSAMLLLVATALCFAPGWHHYFAFLPVAIATVLAGTHASRRSVVLVAAAWLATSLPVFALATDASRYFRFSQWGCTTWAALAVWWALIGQSRERR